MGASVGMGSTGIINCTVGAGVGVISFLVTSRKTQNIQADRIPTSRSGRRNKMGRMLTGGCLMPVLYAIVLVTILFSYIG